MIGFMGRGVGVCEYCNGGGWSWGEWREEVRGGENE